MVKNFIKVYNALWKSQQWSNLLDTRHDLGSKCASNVCKAKAVSFGRPHENQLQKSVSFIPITLWKYKVRTFQTGIGAVGYISKVIIHFPSSNCLQMIKKLKSLFSLMSANLKSNNNHEWPTKGFNLGKKAQTYYHNAIERTS